MIACEEIGLGKLHVPELLGDVHIKPVTADGAYNVKLDTSKEAKNAQISRLLRRYARRGSISGKKV